MHEHPTESRAQHNEGHEWVELMRWSLTDAESQALSLDTLALLPFADTPTINSPTTGRPITVPHGSLLAYARHLLNHWGVADAHFVLRFGQVFGPDVPAEHAMTVPGQRMSPDELARLQAEGKLRSLDDPEFQRALAEGRIIIR